ncbi:hypothetical protein [Limosilactobacillus oris]|nr:hypothetical protein [Limosilactobacillus oris]VTX69086.1 Uncharacterised protein [Limosilactobacillus oris]
MTNLFYKAVDTFLQFTVYTILLVVLSAIMAVIMFAPIPGID